NHHFDQIAIHQTEYELLKQDQNVGGIRKQMAKPDVRAILPPDFDPESYRIAGTTATQTLCDTDKIDLGGRMLHVLHTPGHSAGHVAYFDAEHGFLFSGDTAYRGTMFACFERSDPAAFARSARRLAEVADDVQCVAPGHNEAMQGGAFLHTLATGAEAALNCDLATLPYNEFVRGYEFNAGDFSIYLPNSQTG
ncbi:MAG: MBL fold metallo-hydrolase, partial [Chloroflexi bacterium]|nr:MBL fold metallo-hydrolase [Chloroflexota bacterium]